MIDRITDEIDALGIAYGLMHQYGVGDWHVRYEDELVPVDSPELAGFCDHETQTIYLSRAHMLKCHRDRVFWVVLHEIAHALTPEDEIHGEQFRLKFTELLVKEGLKLWA